MNYSLKWLSVLLMCATISCSGCGGGPEEEPGDGPRKGPKLVLSLATGVDNPRNSEGDFITLGSGRILFVYTHFTGNSFLDDAPAYLASRYSDDNGATWSVQDKLEVASDAQKNVMSVSLLNLKNGDIAMFYLKKNSDADCAAMMRISTDQGASWGDPKPCINDAGVANMCVVNGRVIRLKDGRLIMPVNIMGVGNMPYYSDDEAKTWTRGGIAENKVMSMTNTEPGIVELKDGRLMMYVRTDAPSQYVSYSSDKGLTWTPTQPSNIISATQSPATIVKVPVSGDLLMIWNHNTSSDPEEKGKRTPLNSAISRDDGKTWEFIKAIETNTNGSYCYTSVHFVGDEVLLSYFDWYTVGAFVKKVKLSWFY